MRKTKCQLEPSQKRVYLFHSQFTRAKAEPTYRQGQKDQSQDMIFVRKQAGVTKRTIAVPEGKLQAVT